MSDSFPHLLRQLRGDSPLREAAERAGISHTYLSQLEKGEDPRTGKPIRPSVDTLKGLAKAYNYSYEDLLAQAGYITPESRGGQSGPNPQTLGKGIKIPVLGRVQAGIPIEAIEEIMDYEEITPEMASQGEYFALLIQGDSMEPRMKEGDVVIVRKQEDVDSGDIAVVIVNGHDATIKRFIKRDNGLLLQATNPAYEPMFFTPEEVRSLPVVVVGRVVELRAKF